MSKETVSAMDVENIIDILDSDGLVSILKMINLKVEKMGESVLSSNLDKASFADIGIQLAKHQGALELQRFINTEIANIKKRSK